MVGLIYDSELVPYSVFGMSTTEEGHANFSSFQAKVQDVFQKLFK